MGLFKKNYSTNYLPNPAPVIINSPPVNIVNQIVAPAPNPNPNHWEIIDKISYKSGYVLKVRYFDCTNFEGIKIMVYKGKYKLRKELDPHFSKDKNSPIARFRPTATGWKMACKLAESL